MLSRREALATGGVVAAAAMTPSGAHEIGRAALEQADAAPPRPGDHLIWFDRPADRRIDNLVVGNGRLGAMIAGQPRQEIVPLNEDSLWSGQPYAWEMPDAEATLASVREAVFAHDYGEADRRCRKIQGRFSNSYAPLANLTLALDHSGGQVDRYRRSLDLDEAVARVSYRIDGVTYAREVLASHPAQLILIRLTADRAGAIACELRLDSLLRYSAQADAHGITLEGKAPTYCAPSYTQDVDPVIYSDEPGRGMRFATRLELLSCDGGATVSGDRLRVDGASEMVLAIGAATGFRSYDVPPDLPAEAVLDAAQRPIETARGRAYAALRDEHVADHRALYRRFNLTLGDGGAADLPTDQRLAANASKHDPSLAVLYSNFSRYLLIASSRPGTQAANLQGIWNWQVRPPWSCNYTTNINVQENYWGAEALNLPELAGPMLDFVGEAAKSGAETARKLYGMNGWVVHHNSDLWRLTTPVGEGGGDPTWANFAMAGPWLVRHVWEHYLYSQDRTFLATRAYPLLKGCAEFCADWLVRDPNTGHMTTAPSVSTENSFLGPDGKVHSVSGGCTYDLAAIRELFGFTRNAAALLCVDAAFADRLKSLAEQMPPYKVGKYGQLQEWQFDFAEPQPEQRHISHLYTVFPSWQITPRLTPELARAASISMQRRLAANGATTGWSRSWCVQVFARLGDAKRARENFDALLAGYTTPSLLDTLPSAEGALFQIDGNFAGSAAVIEMILQSQAGVVAFLPALPVEWSEGAVQGVRARGGLTLDMAWSGGRMTSATLTATADGDHRLRAPPGQRITRILAGRRAVPFETIDGDCRVSLLRGYRYAVHFA